MTNRAAEPEVPASVLAARSRAEVLVSAEDVQQAVDRVNEWGGQAFAADLSTCSSAVDMGNRILAAAARTLGKKW